jgi:endoglucanase
MKTHLTIFCLIWVFKFTIASAAGTPRQTTEGRFWLRVPAGQSPLGDVRVSSGTATPAPWEKDAAVRERQIDVIFPVRWWSWREISIEFTPVEDGTVDLILNGPWEEEEPGKTYRKEVLWDTVTAVGTEVFNGDFENQTHGLPDSWKPVYGPYLPVGDWPIIASRPLDGRFLAATYQDRPLAQTLKITAGRKVTITLHAKAATLPGFVEPKRLSPDTPAHRALSKIKRGVNLGNCWDAPPPYSWGIRYSPEDIDHIAAEGFDHIRVPVSWSYHLAKVDGRVQIDPKLLADLEPVLRRALEKGLTVLLNWHHYEELNSDPTHHRSDFVAGWETIARHFKSWPPQLYLEILNEPHDALTTELTNSLHEETLASIRKIDPQRIILVSPGNWGGIQELERIRLPDGDDRLIVTVHCYEPFYFTHQGAGWVHLAKLRGITYPGPPKVPFSLPESFKDHAGVRSFVNDYNRLPADQNPCSANAVRDMLDLAREWSTEFGRPIHLGEFGSHHLADQDSRARYARDVRTLAEERGIPWTLWDWKAGFNYWDSKTNRGLFKAELFD